MVISATGAPATPTFAVMRPPSCANDISTSSIQCGRCQRSIAWSRAAFVVVPTRYG